jgi:hypothetical protein
MPSPRRIPSQVVRHKPNGFCASCFFPPMESVPDLTVSPAALVVSPTPFVAPDTVSPRPFPADPIPSPGWFSVGVMSGGEKEALTKAFAYVADGVADSAGKTLCHAANGICEAAEDSSSFLLLFGHVCSCVLGSVCIILGRAVYMTMRECLIYIQAEAATEGTSGLTSVFLPFFIYEQGISLSDD